MNLPGSSFTAARRKIYPRAVHGRYRNLRNGISLALQAILFGVPWLQWGGRQAILADLPGRKLYLFGLVLHPQDTYFLHLLLILAAVTLFCVSALAGRMWCGYACPQTILSQAFIMVERWWEGDRAARIRLDKAGWTIAKLTRKLGKWVCWSAMGGYLGVTAAGYFFPIRQLTVTPSIVLTVIFFAVWSLFEFGYFREQFCSYVCPYARFQGAMLDDESLVVAYDQSRGEPRGKLKSSGRGSCIDCTACVQACPMGIDIRTGLQLECIACAACVDACDEVMDRVGQERGLIRYTTYTGQDPNPFRPRVAIYLGLITVLGSLLVYLLVNRSPLALDAVRVVSPGGQLAVTTPDGHISNVFKVHLINRLASPQTVNLQAEGLPGADLLGVTNPIQLEPGQVMEAQVMMLLPPGQHHGIRPFSFRVGNTRKEATFVVP
ncbi:cytochrome c oxidase accessory protein CcoG [bacterium]|nr:cytochrome c oxidase accessory protein CcoG [bacterium]